MRMIHPYNRWGVADHCDHPSAGHRSGYLLHKNPAHLHSFELSFGKAHVFYPEAESERCTAALLLDVWQRRMGPVLAVVGELTASGGE
jgi:hypothetical protein